MKKLLFQLLRRLSFDVVVRHHWWRHRKLALHSFQHKNYWFHGKNREREEMLAIRKLVSAGNTVIEVGGHIGYLAIHFGELVGEAGHLYVFEPSPNNLRYLRRNLAGQKNALVIDRAVADRCGTMTLFTEDLSGQNNSLIPNISILSDNAQRAGIVPRKGAVEVEVETIDVFVAKLGRAPDFIKIDVEGAELLVLEGMRDTLNAYHPVVMIEISYEMSQARKFFPDSEWLILDANLEPLSLDSVEPVNAFCIPREKLERYGLQLGAPTSGR